jgi:hypothetical protein
MKPLVFLIILIGGLSFWTQVQDKGHTAQSSNLAKATAQHYIPTDLDDCFRQIDNNWTAAAKTKVLTIEENDFCTAEEVRTGVWIRANWLSGGRLQKYFNDLGVNNTDDMSEIILRSYHRYLHKRDIDISKQVQNVEAVAKAS